MEDYESLPHGLPVSCLEIQQRSLQFFSTHLHPLFFNDHDRGHAYAQALYPLLLVSLALGLHELTLTHTEPALTDPLADTLTAPLTCHAYFRRSTPRSPPSPPTIPIKPQPRVPYLTPPIHQTGSLTVYVNAHLPSIAPSHSRSRSRIRIRFSPPFNPLVYAHLCPPVYVYPHRPPFFIYRPYTRI